LHALVKRGSLSAIGEELGVGKESVVYEGLREMVGAWASSRCHHQVPPRKVHEFQADEAQA
jgi:RIO-like serine/threonine protein kinase